MSCDKFLKEVLSRFSIQLCEICVKQIPILKNSICLINDENWRLARVVYELIFQAHFLKPFPSSDRLIHSLKKGDLT